MQRNGSDRSANESLSLIEGIFAMCIEVKLVLAISTAAKRGAAVSSSRSMGRVKHFSTLFLWIQDYVTRRKIELRKVHVIESVGLLTNDVPSSMMLKMTSELQVRARQSWLCFGSLRVDSSHTLGIAPTRKEKIAGAGKPRER